MSAFLFFLAAIVVTNREDNRFSALCWPTTRCGLNSPPMARSLRYSIDALEPRVGRVPSTTAFLSPAARRCNPASKPAFRSLLELDVQATSNLVWGRSSLVSQEFRLADSLAAGSSKPHLFAMIGRAGRFSVPTSSGRLWAAWPPRCCPTLLAPTGHRCSIRSKTKSLCLPSRFSAPHYGGW